MSRFEIRDAAEYTNRRGTQGALDETLARAIADPEHFVIVERDEAFIQTAHPGQGGPGPAYLEGLQVEYKLGPDQTHWLAFTDDFRQVAAAVRGFAADQPGWSDGFAWQPLELEAPDPDPPDSHKMVKDFGDALQSALGRESFRFYRSRLELSRTVDDMTHVITLRGARQGAAVALQMQAIVRSASLQEWQIHHGRGRGANNGRVACCFVGYLTPHRHHDYPGVDLRHSRATALWVVPNLLNRFVLPFFELFNASHDFVRRLPDAQLNLLFRADVVELLLCRGDTNALSAYLNRWRTGSPQSFLTFTQRLNALAAGAGEDSRRSTTSAADAIHGAGLASLVVAP